MKLIQHTPTVTYQILTDYTEISKESPLISVLKVCKEINVFKASELQDFLKPLNNNAISNLLLRLKSLDYLKDGEGKFDFLEFSEEEKSYELTQMGLDVCLNEEIEEEKRGIITMTVAYPKNAEAIIVRLEALNRDEFQEQERTKSDANRKFTEFINKSQYLKNGTFKLKHIENTYVVGEEKEQDYVFNFSEESYTSQLLDFSKTVKVLRDEVITELLVNKYHNAYDEELQLIRMLFDIKELSLKRNISIEKPIYDGLYFNKVELEKPIQISPLNQQEAERWFAVLVGSRIQNYFFSDEDFNLYTNQIAEEFIEYNQSLANSISRSQIIGKLNKKPAGFYIKAKLDTINYLNY
ncbi:hypothetical protein R5N98_12350 [Tenacibaculum maritimum]|uniref:hypothetical protein n=1 Tax=Tenacibaculum maritimum TaxID=107401 RepID=UPI00388ED6ED